MAVPNPWWKKWLCYISCEWFSKPVFGKRVCVCAYDLLGNKKKVKREHKGKDGGFRFLAMPKTIALIGLDGSGKTTQARRLRVFLDSYGIKNDYVHLPSASLLSKVAGKKVAGCGPKGNGKPCPLTSLGRRGFYFLGVVWIYVSRFFPAFLRGRVVVCDRWFTDEVVHLRYKRMGGRLLLSLTPDPGLGIYLDEKPETAFSRAKEADLDYYVQKKRMYDSLAKGKHITVVRVRGKEETWESVERELRKRFGNLLWER